MEFDKFIDNIVTDVKNHYGAETNMDDRDYFYSYFVGNGGKDFKVTASVKKIDDHSCIKFYVGNKEHEFFISHKHWGAGIGILSSAIRQNLFLTITLNC